MEKVLELTTNDEGLAGVTKLLEEGLEYIILIYIGNYHFTDITSEQREKMADYVQSKYNVDAAKYILQRIKFNVEVNDDNTLTVTWDE